MNGSGTRTSSLRIVVCGYIVRGPLGGLTWHHLQYLLGLVELGHDVWFVEDSGDWPQCYDPRRHVVDADAGYGLAYARQVFARVGLGERWAYHDTLAGGVWHGPAAGRITEVCRTADVLLNLSCINPMRPWLRMIPLRVLVDTDPVFTQVDVLTDPVRRNFAEQHNAFFTFAECIGEPGCSVPDDGLRWRATRQPVVLGAWPLTPAPGDGAWTTVMQWDSYKVREWQGRRWGMKSEEMERVLDLPARCAEQFELALGGPTAPRERLAALGWSLQDPLAITSDPWTYQAYLRGSKAEFSVAKQGYVASGSGWFSERSANYLATGRPVVVQDTGCSRVLPCGEGLLAFSTSDEALAAVQAVCADYRRHASAAREIARVHFDSQRVLGRLLDEAHAAANG